VQQPVTYHVKLQAGIRKEIAALAKSESRTIHNMLQCLIARGVIYSQGGQRA
jgi:hypothetical protein